MDYQNDIVKFQHPPITAIEILSPSQTLTDLIIKMHKMIDVSVKSVWIIMPPTKTVYIFDKKKQQHTFINGIITDSATGIHIDTEAIFE